MKFWFIILSFALSIANIFAQEIDLGVKGVIFKIGPVIPFETYKASYSISLGPELGRIGNNFEPGVDVTYWKVKYDYYGRKDNPNDDIKRRYIGVNFSFFVHPIKEALEFNPYVGLGLALNFYKKDYPEGWPDKDKNLTNLEPHIDLGGKIGLYSNIDGELHLRLTLSEIDNLLLLLGVRFGLEK